MRYIIHTVNQVVIERVAVQYRHLMYRIIV
jgi:hypothetical protein